MTQSLILESLSAQQIFDDNMGDLKLSWVGGLEGADRKFPSEAVLAASASSDLVGHLNLIHPKFLVRKKLPIMQHLSPSNVICNSLACSRKIRHA
jgi:hypothetical protein